MDLLNKILQLDSVYEGDGQQGGFQTNDPKEAIREVIQRAIGVPTAQFPITENMQLNLGPNLDEASIGGEFDVGGGQFTIGGGMRGDDKAFGIGFRKEFAEAGSVKSYTQEMNDTAQFLYGKDFKDLPINLRNKVRYGKYTKDPISYEQYLEDYKNIAADPEYKPKYIKRSTIRGAISPQQKRALEEARKSIEGFQQKFNKNMNLRARLARKEDPEKVKIDKSARAEYKAQYRAGIDDVKPTDREKLINKRQRAVVNEYNEPIKKNPNLILKNPNLMKDLSTTVSNTGDIIYIKPALNYLKEKGIYEVEHQRDFAKKGKMKNLPYNRNIIFAPHNRKGGFKNMAETFIENNPDSPKIENILKKAKDLKITLQPMVAKGTFPTKGLGYKQLADPVEKFVDVASKTTPSKTTFNTLLPLANIGCPNKKSDGGRVNFFEGQDLTACAMKGAEKLKNTNPKDLDSLAKSNIKKLTKTAQGARFLKNTLGPVALAYEGLFALPFAALDYAEGRKGKDILMNALTLGLKDESLRKDELKEFFGSAGKGDEFIKALNDVQRLSKQSFTGTKKQKQRAIPLYNKAFDRFEKTMQPFMRVNPQIEAGEMFSPELLEKNLADTREAEKKVLESYDKRLREREIGPYSKPFDFSYGGFSNGGIAGLSGGDKSGPPPERGPDSQGLRSLMKRGINL